MNYEWDLSILYSGFDSPEFSEDMKALSSAISDTKVLAESADNMPHAELIKKFIKVSEAINEYAKKLIIYSNLRYSANTADTAASSNIGKVMGMLSEVSAPDAKISKISHTTKFLKVF